MNTNKEMIEQVVHSELFKDYERAYNSATGLPLAFRPLETFDLPFQGKRRENGFCALMAKKGGSCGDCLKMQDKLHRESLEKTTTAKCIHGLCEAAVPVRLGHKVIGFLQTGQVFTEKPSEAKIEKAVSHAQQLSGKETRETVRTAYLNTPVVARDKFQSTLKLLGSFADLISLKSNQIAMTQSNAEPLIVTKAKKVIEDHLAEEVSLTQVAKQIHVSTFYLCKLFRKSTGVTFTEFVSRARIERAKNLLLSPNLRVSEIVYEVGFQSLTHFNRVFKKLVGESPTQYRARIPGHRNGPVSLCESLRPGSTVMALARAA